MKYIRTKDGIFRRYKNSKIIDNVFYYPDDGMFPEYRREPILKQADTIEELCDEFVWENKLLGKGNVVFESKSTYVSKCGFIPFADWGYEIYGAIWTERGLKYVAKMNDKGELELL